MEIITNNQWRDFLYGYEVPFQIMSSQFDHLSNDDKHDKFIRYDGTYYHLSEFIRIVPQGKDDPNMFVFRDVDGQLEGWQGMHTDMCVVIKVSDDGEQYKIATFYD